MMHLPLRKSFRIYLIRHGTTQLNQDGKLRGWIDVKLNGKGLREAKAIGKFFSRIKVNYVYSSDLKRCLQIAERINPNKIVQDSRLRPINFAELNGKPLNLIGDKLDKLSDIWKTDPHHRIEGGESLYDFSVRLESFWKDLFRNHKNGDVICVVTHVRNCIATLAWFANRMEGIDPDLFSLFNQDESCITFIDYDLEYKKPRIERMNYKEHLGGKK